MRVLAGGGGFLLQCLGRYGHQVRGGDVVDEGGDEPRSVAEGGAVEVREWAQFGLQLFSRDLVGAQCIPHHSREVSTVCARGSEVNDRPCCRRDRQAVE